MMTRQFQTLKVAVPLDTWTLPWTDCRKAMTTLVVGVGMTWVGPGAEMTGYTAEASDKTEKEQLPKRGGNACLSICAYRGASQ